MDDINPNLVIDKEEVDKLIFDSFMSLNNYWTKYRSDKYKNEFFSPNDYESINNLIYQVKALNYYVSKFGLDVEVFNPFIPFDLKWKIPAMKDKYINNVNDMTLLCDDVKSLTDDLEIAYEKIRNNFKQPKMFTKDDYLNVLFDIYHIKLITEYGIKTYGLTWDGLNVDFPEDLKAKVPPELRGLTHEDFPL